MRKVKYNLYQYMIVRIAILTELYNILYLALNYPINLLLLEVGNAINAFWRQIIVPLIGPTNKSFMCA